MCSVSAVMDYGRREFWPNHDLLYRPPYQPVEPYTPTPLQPFPPLSTETPEDKLREFLKLYEAAKEYDRKTAQPDCEDPMKMQVLERILERLDQIERRLGDGGSDGVGDGGTEI